MFTFNKITFALVNLIFGIKGQIKTDKHFYCNYINPKLSYQIKIQNAPLPPS